MEEVEAVLFFCCFETSPPFFLSTNHLEGMGLVGAVLFLLPRAVRRFLLLQGADTVALGMVKAGVEA